MSFQHTNFKEYPIENDKTLLPNHPLAEVNEDEIRAKEKEVIVKYEITEKENMVIQMRLRFPNARATDIAKLLSFDKGEVQRILNRPDVILAINDLSGSWTTILLRSKEKAARALVELLASKNSYIRLKAAEDILQLQKVHLSSDTELSPF